MWEQVQSWTTLLQWIGTCVDTAYNIKHCGKYMDMTQTETKTGTNKNRQTWDEIMNHKIHDR
jgi:hypothetical protein